MKVIYLIGIITVLILLLLFFINNNHAKGEGFATEKEQHDEFSKKYQQKYNNVGNALVATNNEKILGQETGGIFGNIQDTMESDGKIKQYKKSELYELLVNKIKK
jgi:hypothetical protein